MTQNDPRILYIIGQLTRGGAEQQFYYLLKYLHPQARVIVLNGGGYWAGPIRDLGYEVIELKRRGRGDLLRLWRIVKEIREYRPDIVHLFTDNLYGLYGRLAAILTGQRHVIVGERIQMTFDPAWYLWLQTVILNRFVLRIVANARIAREYLITKMHTPPDRVLFIPNGLELDRIRVEAALGENPLPAGWHGKTIVGMVASLSPRKRPDLFVIAAAQIIRQRPDTRFVWIGAGELRLAIEQQIAVMKLGDTFLLAGERHDIPRWLAAMDIFLFTSELEGTPNAIMEAMAVGLPVICAEIDGCADLVQNDVTGYLVPSGDVTAFVDCTLRLIDSPVDRARLGKIAAKAITVYDVDRMAVQYGDLYRAILGI